MSSTIFDPHNVDLDTASPRDIACYQQLSRTNEYSGDIGGRVAALFVILLVSTATTLFPVAAKRVKWLRIPLYAYLFARNFGSGVIVATGFIHLLDPAYQSIGPFTCIGLTPGMWSAYSWTPAIVLTSCLLTFLVDVACQEYVRQKYGFETATSVEEAIVAVTAEDTAVKAAATEEGEACCDCECADYAADARKKRQLDEELERLNLTAFRQQFMAFFILEAGIILHSVFIGLNFGVAGAEWKVLFVVLIFHQSFEGLGIGARMSVIPFPADLDRWLPWTLCVAYGLTTPVSIGIGLAVRGTYNAGSATANIVSGVANAISAGILIYNSLVELLARDFLFEPEKKRDLRRLCFMAACVVFGAGIMSLLAKWA